MPDFAANLSTMFTELPFLERFGAAARCGFDAVELATPYAVPKEAVARELREHELALVVFDLPSGRGEEAERGIACHPDREAQILDQRALRRQLPLPQLPRRHCAGWRRRRDGAAHADRESALCRAPRNARRHHHPGRAGRSRDAARQRPPPNGRRSRPPRRGGRTQPLAALRRLSHASDGRERDCRHRAPSCPHRPHPDRRLSGSGRADRRLDRL